MKFTKKETVTAVIAIGLIAGSVGVYGAVASNQGKKVADENAEKVAITDAGYAVASEKTPDITAPPEGDNWHLFNSDPAPIFVKKVDGDFFDFDAQFEKNASYYKENNITVEYRGIITYKEFQTTFSPNAIDHSFADDYPVYAVKLVYNDGLETSKGKFTVGWEIGYCDAYSGETIGYFVDGTDFTPFDDSELSRYEKIQKVSGKRSMLAAEAGRKIMELKKYYPDKAEEIDEWYLALCDITRTSTLGGITEGDYSLLDSMLE
jgi:hypothetical protein